MEVLYHQYDETEYRIKMSNSFYSVLFIYKRKRRNPNLGTCYAYVGDSEKPFILKFYLNAYGGKFPALHDTSEWINISLNLWRFKVRHLLNAFTEDSIVDSLYYNAFKNLDICKPKEMQKLLWE
jgi:hypothetical protein